jgi:hypothetical protein
MSISAFNSGGSTIKAELLTDAIYRSIILLSILESKANRDNPNQQTSYVNFQILGDATKTFTATLSLPARMVKDAISKKINLVPRNFIVDYINWVPGTGDLADAPNLPAAIVSLCEQATYLERQINPNVTIQTPNQVNITPNQENGTFDITVNLPVEILLDETTGQVSYGMFDYLFVLDTQLAHEAGNTTPTPTPVIVGP